MKSFGTASEIINSEVKKHPESCAQSGIELHPICPTVCHTVGQMGCFIMLREKPKLTLQSSLSTLYALHSQSIILMLSITG